MRIKLDRAEFFTTDTEHAFYFVIDDGEGGQCELPILTEEDGGGIEGRWDLAHSNLVTMLEQALETAQRLLQARPWAGEGQAPRLQSEDRGQG